MNNAFTGFVSAPKRLFNDGENLEIDMITVVPLILKAKLALTHLSNHYEFLTDVKNIFHLLCNFYQLYFRNLDGDKIR